MAALCVIALFWFASAATVYGIIQERYRRIFGVWRVSDRSVWIMMAFLGGPFLLAALAADAWHGPGAGESEASW